MLSSSSNRPYPSRYPSSRWSRTENDHLVSLMNLKSKVEFPFGVLVTTDSKRGAAHLSNQPDSDTNDDDPRAESQLLSRPKAPLWVSTNTKKGRWWEAWQTSIKFKLMVWWKVSSWFRFTG
jgi:hypothetical protein